MCKKKKKKKEKQTNKTTHRSWGLGLRHCWRVVCLTSHGTMEVLQCLTIGFLGGFGYSFNFPVYSVLF
jgi:hypothetical protein